MTSADAPPVRALTTVAQASMVAFGIVMAIVGAIVPALTDRLAFTLGEVGTLFLAMNAAMLVASLTLGLVVDRFGLKPALSAGAGLVAVGLLLIGRADRYADLLPAVACLGFGGGLLNGGANTLVADLHADEARKAAALNRLGVFFGFGALLMPFSLGALTAALGVGGLLVAAALACGVTGLAAALLRFPPPKQAQGWPLGQMPRFLRMPFVVAIAFLLFLQSGNEFALGGYISSFLTGELRVTLTRSSYALAAYWAAIMVGRMVVSGVLSRVPGGLVVLGSAASAALGALVLAWAPTPVAAIAGAVFTGLALAGIFPTVLGLAAARFQEHSGTVFGILFTIALSGGMTIPWLAGHLADAAGLRWVFVLVAANFAGVALLSVAARKVGQEA